MDEATVITMDSLRDLGFQPDPTIVCDGCPDLSFDFGNLTLRASSCINLRCVEIVFFTGVLSTLRSLAEVQFEMPRRLKSTSMLLWLPAKKVSKPSARGLTANFARSSKRSPPTRSALCLLLYTWLSESLLKESSPRRRKVRDPIPPDPVLRDAHCDLRRTGVRSSVAAQRLCEPRIGRGLHRSSANMPL